MKRLLLPLRISLLFKVTDNPKLLISQGSNVEASSVSLFMQLFRECYQDRKVETSPQGVKRKHTDEVTQVVKQEYVEEEPQNVTRKFWS